MCEHGDVVEMTLPIVNNFRFGVADIDRCIAPIIKALNAGGVTTLGCCCGHGETTGYIHLADGRYLAVLSNASAFKEIRVRRPKYHVQDTLITIALAEVGGHREKAAKLLRMPVRTLQRRLKRRRELDGKEI